MAKTYYYYMQASNMNGPHTLNETKVKKKIFDNMGVYLFADKSTKKGVKRKVVKYVGRGNLADRFKKRIGVYDYFYYVTRADEDTAFKKECKEYHRYGKSDHLKNLIHPAKPEGSKLPICTELGCKGEVN